MSAKDDETEREAFAAWAATEGITNVVFSPVTAVGRTLGNVSGQRDFHLVLLDREWGIWQAARASRPREAGSWAVGCGECDGGNFGFLKDGVRKHYRFDGGTYECPRVPATPASAAGREGAHGPGKCLSVDAIEFDRTVASREQDERERWIREDERAKCLHAAKHSPACKGCKRVMANAIRALLAAEAEGGGA